MTVCTSNDTSSKMHCVNGVQIEKYKNAMFFLNPRDLSENLSPWSIRSKDDIYQFWSSLLHCCFCKEHNIVLSKAGFTFLYNWIKSFMGSFLSLAPHLQKLEELWDSILMGVEELSLNYGILCKHFGTVTQCLVNPRVPVLLTAKLS